jgi:hypothetical protein
MKTKLLLAVGLIFTASASASHAGGAAGVRWGGGGGSAVGVRWGGGGAGAVGVRWGGNRYCGGGYWGGRSYWAPRYYAPRAYYGGWGWGWRAPVVRVVTPAPIITAAYVAPAVRVASVRVSVVVSAQEQLADLGYYGGTIDGAFGPQTSAAVLRYQRDYGLPVTGRLDGNTRASLGI